MVIVSGRSKRPQPKPRVIDMKVSQRLMPKPGSAANQILMTPYFLRWTSCETLSIHVMLVMELLDESRPELNDVDPAWDQRILIFSLEYHNRRGDRGICCHMNEQSTPCEHRTPATIQCGRFPAPLSACQAAIDVGADFAVPLNVDIGVIRLADRLLPRFRWRAAGVLHGLWSVALIIRRLCDANTGG